MLDIATDLATVFFGPDFAQPFLRQRPMAADIVVMCIIGTVDAEALDGRALAATRQAHFAAGQDIRADDKLTAQAAMGASGVAAGTAFRVLDKTRRVTDGLEMSAPIGAWVA